MFLNPNGYVVVKKCKLAAGKLLQYLHRVIMYSPELVDTKRVIDHINGDKLDNRRCNLRVCSQQQNACNRIKNAGSIYKGVSAFNGRYRVYIKAAGVSYFLGTFDSIDMAAMKYNDAAIQLHGKYALLNVILPVQSCQNEVSNSILQVVSCQNEPIHDQNEACDTL